MAQTAAENSRRQRLARYEYERTQRARDKFYAQSVPGERATTEHRPRYSSETEASFVSFTTLAAPKPAKKAFRKAEKAAAKPDIEAAVDYLEQAIELYPQYAAAWTLLGRTRFQAGDHEEAALALRRSVEIDPAYLNPYPDLAYLAVLDGNWSHVINLADQMIRINPSFTLGYYYRGYALLQRGELQPAERALSTAIATPDARMFPEARYILGEVYRHQAAYPLAAIEYRRFVEVVPRGEWSAKASDWLEQWEDLGVVLPAP